MNEIVSWNVPPRLHVNEVEFGAPPGYCFFARFKRDCDSEFKFYSIMIPNRETAALDGAFKAIAEQANVSENVLRSEFEQENKRVSDRWTAHLRQLNPDAETYIP
jgi:hypothetical protein